MLLKTTQRMNFTYNATLEMMDLPIIKFPNQTEPVHRLLVFLKCFIATTLETNEVEMMLVHQLRHYLVSCFMPLAFIMVALSEELWRKAIPMFMFCYACQVQNLFSVDANIRRCFSYLIFVFCCLELFGFEFLYDFYIIFCVSFKSLYCLCQARDHEQKERSGLQRAQGLMLLITDTVMFLCKIEFWIILFVNSFVAVLMNVAVQSTQHVTILYILMSKLLLVEFAMKVDLGGMFDDMLKQMGKNAVNFVLQFFRGA